MVDLEALDAFKVDCIYTCLYEVSETVIFDKWGGRERVPDPFNRYDGTAKSLSLYAIGYPFVHQLHLQLLIVR